MTGNRWVIAMLVGVVACAKPRSEAQLALQKMEELGAKMCLCTDRACAETVNAELTRWGTEMAKSSNPEKPSPELVQQMTATMERYAECMTRAMQVVTAPPGKPRTQLVEDVVGAAREHVAATRSQLVLSKLAANYVRADGTVDPTYGSVLVEFRARGVADNRPIGAPVRPTASPATTEIECPAFTYEGGAWTVATTDCEPRAQLLPARCTVKQIWQRAIAERAPAAALASLALDAAVDAKPQAWSFAIVDEPRDIDIRKQFDDDCTPLVEAP